MDALPKLSKADVLAYVGPREVDKGRPYAQRGALLRLRVQEGVLKADCLGTAPTPYRVEVTLTGTGARAFCSCPVGGDGRCKHVAALLLTYVNAPEQFTEVEALRTTLERYGKEDLITLIDRMVERYPDLETLVQTSAPDLTDTPVNPEAVRAQVQGMLRNASFARERRGWDDYGYGYGGHVEEDLKGVLTLAERYLDAGDVNSAATAYATVASEVMENYHEYEDEEGSLASLAQACAEGLGRCLAAARDANTREIVLSAMFELYCEDLELGGYGIGDGVPDDILEHATDDEKAEVAGWLQEALPKGDGFGKSFERKEMGSFLLKLQEGADDETFLRIARQTGRWRDLVGRLLALGRVAEAEEAARGTDDYTLLTLTEPFREAGEEDIAHKLVLARTRTSDDWRLLEWLRDDYAARGEDARALEVAQTLFWRRPSVAGYEDVRTLARRKGRWEALRETVQARLREGGEDALLTEIHLLEGDVDAALESLARATRGSVWPQTQLTLEVAGDAERTHPDEAAALYQREAERRIAARGRENYKEAARYLGRAAALFDRQGKFDAWEKYLLGLREAHRRLRALHEELDKAGL